jgi:hypothetical protein
MRWIIDIQARLKELLVKFPGAFGIRVCVGHVDRCNLIFEGLFILCSTAPHASFVKARLALCNFMSVLWRRHSTVQTRQAFATFQHNNHALTEGRRNQ